MNSSGPSAETLKRDVPLMITEINLNWNPAVNAGNHGGSSLFAGLWMAEIIGISADQGLAAVLPWTAVRGDGLPGPILGEPVQFAGRFAATAGGRVVVHDQ